MHIPTSARLAVERILAAGAKKHGTHGYMTGDPDDYLEAARGHLVSWRRTRQPDPESGESHLAHAIARLILLYDREES